MLVIDSYFNGIKFFFIGTLKRKQCNLQKILLMLNNKGYFYTYILFLKNIQLFITILLFMKNINGLLIFPEAWLIAKRLLINIPLSKYFIKIGKTVVKILKIFIY